jgi:hypothetical protein
MQKTPYHFQKMILTVQLMQQNDTLEVNSLGRYLEVSDVPDHEMQPNIFIREKFKSCTR